MAATHLDHHNMAIDKYSGTDPDQDAESFIQITDRKVIFSPGDAPAGPDEFANYTFWEGSTVFFFTSGTSC